MNGQVLMSYYERKKARIEENRRRIFERDNWHCQYKNCYSSEIEIAHRVAKSESNKAEMRMHWLRKYKIELTYGQLDAIMNHDFNIVSSCSKHNSYFNIGFNKVEKYKLLDRIYKDLYA